MTFILEVQWMTERDRLYPSEVYSTMQERKGLPTAKEYITVQFGTHNERET